jgi:hypothetical protein
MATRIGHEASNGPLLLADISGYTSFLQGVADAHRNDALAGDTVPEAYAMMSSLLDGIVERLVPPFTLSKLEGDAVFAFAGPADPVPHGAALLECVQACYAEFRNALAQAGEIWTCTCNSCSLAAGLDLKFVIHAGPYVLQRIAGSRELSGPEVVMAHRLLKNHVAERIGGAAYLLLTDAAVRQLEISTEGSISTLERYEHYPRISAVAFPLRAG